VELRSVETVTDVGMEAIAKAVAGNLRELTIASLEQVTDTALHHFAEYCPNLRTLQLSGTTHCIVARATHNPSRHTTNDTTHDTTNDTTRHTLQECRQMIRRRS
jgi:hypothetical protein